MCRFILTSVSLILAMIFLFSGCSSKEPTVRSEKKSDPAATSVAETSDRTNQSASNQLNDQLVLSGRNSAHYSMIALASGNYLTAFGAVPENLQSLLNGFCFVWPGSVYTKKPIGIINHMPNPDDEDDIGKVFYERISDSEAIIHFLSVDFQISTGEEIKWYVNKRESDPKVKGLIDENLGYKINLFQAISIPMTDSCSQDGLLDQNLVDLLTNNNYFIMDKGIPKVESMIDQGLKFDFGDIGAEKHFYYETFTFDQESIGKGQMQFYQVRKCKEIELDLDENGEEYIVSSLKDGMLIECPEPANNANSIFKSESFNSYNIDSNLVIDREAILP